MRRLRGGLVGSASAAALVVAAGPGAAGRRHHHARQPGHRRRPGQRVERLPGGTDSDLDVFVRHPAPASTP